MAAQTSEKLEKLDRKSPPVPHFLIDLHQAKIYLLPQ